MSGGFPVAGAAHAIRASHEIVERALALSRADGAIVIASESSTVNLRWANNTLTTNGAARDRSVTVISVVGRSFGVRTTSAVDGPGGDGDLAVLEALVRASESAARESEDAEDYSELITPAGGPPAASAGSPAPPGSPASPVGVFTDPAERTSSAVFAAFARDLAEAFGAARAEDRRLFGFASHDLTTTWLGTSTGLRLRHSQPTGSVEWNAKSNAPGGSVWHGQSTPDFTDVDVAATDEHLRARLAWCDRSVDLPAGRYETLLPPSAVADLMVDLYWSAAGRDAAEGRTVFSRPGGGTRIGEMIGPAGLRLWSDPGAAGLATTPFVTATSSSATSSVFDNGLPLGPTDWILDGRLNALVQTRASARSAGHADAAPGTPVTPLVDNLLLDGGGTASLDDMIASTRRGLLLTCLWYIREVDPEVLLLTGLTRDGVFLVEDGEVVGAVNNFRFNESPVDLLGRATEIGATARTLPREWADWFTLARMPTLRIPDFNMSSVSPAS
ncbi:metallopeptidase TldD-related protein [Parafrankia sp. EUN1f]|uniref:metallopeptidase TldD-related protein n=1 Tax=Parafrankia sp. EUN1f TaxID=102897 RepID=UPI0001C46CC4|nr:metallopeptidase TldD-related protein [Parafrankia sp. EUN1f]EFC80339.1 Zn-dependent protease [Parafrankia sp. EUN1f]